MPDFFVFSLPWMPDINMPKYWNIYGNAGKAHEKLSRIVYEYICIMTSFCPPGSMTITLRYSYDPGKKESLPQNRLSVYLLTSLENTLPDDLLAEYISIAGAILEPLCGHRIAPLNNNDGECNSTLSKCQYISTFYKNDRIAIDEVTQQFKDTSKVISSYLIEPFHNIGNDSSLDVMFWDNLFDKINQEVVVDLSFRRTDLVSSQLELSINGEISRIERKVFQYRDYANTVTEEEKRPPTNVEYVKKRYEDLLKKSQIGPAFEFSIRVATRRESGWLVNCVASELTGFGRYHLRMYSDNVVSNVKAMMEAGRFDLQQKEGSYSRKMRSDQINLRNLQLDVNEYENWKRLTLLKHVLSGESVSKMIQLPIPRTGILKTMMIETEFIKEKKLECEPKIDIGKVLGQSKSVQLTLGQLNKHVFVAGVTGSGKTTTIFEILIQLWRDHKIPFLVIESAKTEYRKLKKHPDLQKDLRLYSCGDDRLSPFQLNPFKFSKPLTLDEHLGNLEACFKGALPMFSPITEIVLATLEQVYIDKWGINPKEFTGYEFNEKFPVMKDLESALGTVMKDFQYSDKTALDIVTATRVRLTTLSRRAVGKIFASHDSNPGIEELLACPTIIEMDKLNQEHANLVTLFILFALRQQLKKPSERRGLKNILVVEEAHNLVGSSAGDLSHVENVASPKAEATNFMVKMLAEVRSLGLGIIIADQTPAAVAPEVVKNTSVKIVHRTVAGDDRESLSEAMLLDEAQSEDLARLEPGQCFVYHENVYRPLMAEVKQTCDLPILSDVDISTILANEPWFKAPVEAKLQSVKEKWEKKLLRISSMGKLTLKREKTDFFPIYKKEIEADFSIRLTGKYADLYASERKAIIDKLNSF